MKKTGHIEEFIRLMGQFHKLQGKAALKDLDQAITPLQFGALWYIVKHPRSSVGLLANYLGLSSSAIAQLTDRLVGSKLIIRKNDARDRRTVLLSATKRGSQTCMKLYKARIQKMKKILAFMPEADLTELIRIFSTLLKKLQAERLRMG